MSSPLLNPDNRLLSWSIGDIGLYGAALTPATIAAADEARAEREAIENGAARPAASDDASATSAALAGPAPGDMADMAPTSVLAGFIPATGTDGALTAASPTIPIIAPTLAPADAAPGVPNPVGSGSLSTALPQPPAPYVADGDMGSSGSQAANALASPILSAPAMTSGSGVTTPLVNGALETAQASAIAATAVAEAALAGVSDQVAAVTGTIVQPTLDTALDEVGAVSTSLGGALNGATESIAVTVASATDALSGVVGTTEALAPVATVTVTDTLGDTTSAAANLAGSTIAGVADTTTAATDAAQAITPAVAETTAGVVDTAQDVTSTVAPVVADTTGAVGDTADTVAAAVTPAVADVVDSLTTSGGASSPAAGNDLLGDIGGADPAAGVATLVDMVASADEFDLSHVVTAPAGEDSGSIADLLATDIADAPLLGDTHTDDHATDDDHGGLLGL